MKLTFLGTGTSHGIPVPACTCPVCRSHDPHDTRWRSSILLEQDGRTLVVDTGPEFRLQALRAGIQKIDGVLYTHAHADHIAGFDDLRVFCRDRVLDVYGDRPTMEHLALSNGYAFHAVRGPADAVPHVRARVLEPYRTVTIAGFPVTPLPISHGAATIFAYRIGSLVYATDCSGIPPQSLDAMKGCAVLVVDGLRYTPHPTHFSVSQAMEAAWETGAGMTYLTHMNHHIQHRALSITLPATIQPAFDGLTVEVP